MPTITLDEIKESIERKYEPLNITLPDGTTVTLVQALRLPSARRAEIRAIQENISRDGITDTEVMDGCRGILKAAATNQVAAGKLLKAIGDDLAALQELLMEYGKASQVGEASSSPS